MEPRQRSNARFSFFQRVMHLNWCAWLPSRGNVAFTLVVIAALFWAQSAHALPWTEKPAASSVASTSTWPYQGRLADAVGNPITASVPMVFRLYTGPSTGTILWEEQWIGANSVQVSNGLFNVMLGSFTPIPQSIVSSNSSLWLGITVGTDSEMTPRVQLGSVPFAAQALTVPDGSITTAKVADGAVTSDKMAMTYWSISYTTTSHWTTTVHDQYVEVPNLNFSFTPLKDGVVFLILSVNFKHSVTGTQLLCAIAVNDGQVAVSNITFTGNEENCATNIAYPVLAGQSYRFAVNVYSNTAGTLDVHLNHFSNLSAFYAAAP